MFLKCQMEESAEERNEKEEQISYKIKTIGQIQVKS